jgi:polysaccharide export outer membrane protein
MANPARRMRVKTFVASRRFPAMIFSMKNMIANTTFSRTWPAVKWACLLLAAATAFTGCETMPSGNTSPAAKAAMEKAHSEMIVLREGDVLKITFPGSANLDTIQPIRRDGKINMNLVGEVDAAGMTPDDLQKKLVSLYASQISSKEITVQVQSSTFPVFVTGAVVKPGKVLSDHPMTALEAVMEAGGFNYDTSNLKAVQIIRNENGVMQHFTVDLKAVLQGKETKPFYLKPGDIVYVPERFSAF